MAVPPPRVAIAAPALPTDRPVPTTSPSPDSAVTPGGTRNGQTLRPDTDALQWIPRNGARSKTGKDKAGWGNLPVEILHRVLSFARDDISLDLILESFYGERSARPNEIALALVHRVWFCRMRLVSSGWRSAVDSHSFWPDYTLTIDPSRHHASTISDLHSARLTPSTPTFPTLFHRARNTTLSSCLACRLNHPSRLGYYPAVAKRMTYTSRFGFAPTCDKHAGTFCTSCLRESEPLAGRNSISGGIISSTPSPREYGMSLMLSPCNLGDVDERGVERPPRALVCPDCRRQSIWNQIQLNLVACARGTYLRGNRAPWLSNEKLKDYVDFNVGTAFEMGYAAVEEQWLKDHTRWDELFETALALQNHERALKLQFMTTATEETKSQRDERVARLAELRGEDSNGRETEEDAMEMEALYRSWWREIEEEELSSDEEEDDELLNEKYGLKLKIGCINDFVSDRIRYAFWVLPSDELEKLVSDDQSRKSDRSGAIHTSLLDIATNFTHPFAGFVPFAYQPNHAYIDTVGFMAIQPSPAPNITRLEGPADPFYPPDRLLRQLDSAFTEVLTRRTGGALYNVAHFVRQSCASDEEAEHECESLTVEDILSRLTAWEVWVPRALAEGVLDAERDKEEAELRAAQKVWEEESGPEIVVVDESKEEEDGTAVYEQVSSDEKSSSSSATLGKRKSSRPASPHDKRQRASPTTPPAQISADATLLEVTLEPSQGLKRKAPPSPASHHIDKNRKEVTPPPGPTFEVGKDGGLEMKRTRVESLAAGDDSSVAASSAPVSPTPVAKVLDDVSERTSSTETVGDLPVTPQESWVLGDGEGEAVLKDASMDDEEEELFEVGLEEKARAPLQARPDEEQLAAGPATPRSPSTISGVSSVPTGSPSPPLARELSPVSHARSRLGNYMTRTEHIVPFIPLTSIPIQLPPTHPLAGHGPVSLPINLGQGANRALLAAFYESRADLRECKCRICERARKKAWDNLEAMRQLVASGEIGWEALLS
ncbi:hypothetical protein I350_06741 [Cryptococcus amylolentus CBS 6273]|uniref:F-box domain-containing protein n=1 Tax=Cryptococcus amylolentus CBS 6273 TaxID=1296118 RepID=A0A1E3JHJ1_9TREE|nr:hypothetical protein I350_06741 [Cryptococcus amylolentus CBS 6273]